MFKAKQIQLKMASLTPDPATVATFTRPPSNQPRQAKPGQLTQHQLDTYFDKGFLIIENFFDIETELEPVRRDIEGLVDELAEKLFKAGKVKDLYKEDDLFSRLTKLDKEHPGANVLLIKYKFLPANVCALWSNERLLNIMEQLLGTEDIQGHPVWNLRAKTPQNEETTVPWHQDAGYLEETSYNVLQPTAWIPLLDTNEKNGCMQMMSGGHRTGRVATHECCDGNTWYVTLPEATIEKELDVNMKEDKVLCEVPYGSLLLLNNLIPHRSLNNLSGAIRWSLDLRWQNADQPVGFYGLKDGIRMRASAGPIDIAWNEYNQVKKRDGDRVYFEPPTFYIEDSRIAGPWMGKWELTNTNVHTDLFIQQRAEAEARQH